MRKRGLDPYSVCCVVQLPARALPAVCVANHLVADVPAVLELCPNLGKMLSWNCRWVVGWVLCWSVVGERRPGMG